MGGMAFGFDIETCMHALKVNNDDLERAQAWLMGPQVTAWKRSQIGTDEPGINDMDTPRWESAKSISQQFGMPPKLCWHALQINRDDTPATINWLFGDAGQRYVQSMEAEAESQRRAKNRGGNNGAPDAALVQEITSMGFTEGQAHIALAHTSGVAQAVDWLFEHPNAEEEAAVMHSASESQAVEVSGEDIADSSDNGLDDAAALEELGGSGEALLRDNSTIEVESSSSSHASRNESNKQSAVKEGGGGVRSRCGEPEVILAKVFIKDANDDAPEEERLIHLMPGMLVVESESVGPCDLGFLCVPVGTIVEGENGGPIVTLSMKENMSSPSVEVRVRFLDPDLGIA